MRAILCLMVAFALAAYLFIADPFGTAEPERCPGGICPTPEHADDQAIPATKAFAQASLVKPLPLSQPVLRAVVKDKDAYSVAASREPARPLLISRDGWRIRLFYPNSAKNIAHAITDEINSNTGLSMFCNRFGFDSLSTSDSRFADWQEMGYPEDMISLALISPNNRSIYYVHRVLKSPKELLASLQEKVDDYYGERDGFTFRQTINTSDRRPRR